ncbi:MAG TPA: prepilin-type N-terminal cleavage/methylation domain-containing protein [Terriglobales bacterium]|nr:prepilin-type N-terminal cleavage/methylation domain-containing protein [Terriglobales bacterium]
MGQRGFTLLEVLIAVTIFAIISSSMYGVVASTLVAGNHAEARADLYASGRELVLRMADELEGALPPLASSDIAFVGEHGSGSRPQDVIRFFVTVRRMHSAAQRYGGRALVEYSLDPLEGQPGVFALRRHEEFFVPAGLSEGSAEIGSEEPGMEQDGGAAGQMESIPTARYLTDRVAGLKFAYADPISSEFVDTWDTTAIQPGESPVGLPAAVQISLFLYDDTGATHEFSTVADLPLGNLMPTPGAL